MSTPGVSLFQGAESIQVNNSLDRAEEEEALEDQRRRNEELGNLLQNAFDDLEDDETTMDSTTNLDLIENNNIHHNHINNNNNNAHHNNNNNNNGKMLQMHFNNFEAEVHQLKMLIEARTNEMEHFKQLSHEEQRKRDELQKRLAITEAELDRALSAKTNQHELLVESKEKCSNLENTIGKLRNDKKQLEHENNTLLGKLETTQTLLGDVQRKYDMVERDLNKHNSRQEELRRKQLEERHRAEMEMMQQQMDTLTDKLERKQSELESLNARYHALQESHEKMLVEKSSRINELTNALSEVQEKCEELLSKGNYFEENVRLQKLIKQLQQQICGMEKTIENLNDRLQYTTAELDVMDSLLHQHNLDDSPRRLSRAAGSSTTNKASAGVVGSTTLNTADRVGSFKDELYRALANVKNKRDEVRKLQALLEVKSSEIKVLHDLENKSLVEITTLKEDNIRLENRVKLLEQELDEKSSKDSETTYQKLLKEKQVELQNLHLQQEELEKRYKEAEAEAVNHDTQRKKLDGQLRNLQVDLEELRQEHDNLKRNYEQTQLEYKQLQERHKEAENWHLDLERHKFLLKDAQAECQRLKKLYVEISNSKETMQYELDKLRQSDSNKQLHELREKVASLQRALQLAEVKSSELSKLLEHEKECREQEVREMRQRLEKATQRELEQEAEINNCNKCLQHLAKITEFEIENIKLSNVHAASREQIDDLSKQLTQAESTITALREQLKLSEQQEQLISELKTKAHKFEQYIKNSSSSSSTDKSHSIEKRHSSTNTTPDLEKIEVKKLETRLREEIAQIFAQELKRFQTRLHQSEEKFLALSREFQHTKAQLQQRDTEVDVLKQAILAEREKMSEMLQQQHLECVEVVAKKESLLQGCHEALKQKEHKLHELSTELQERQEQIEAERQSMKAVMCQWEIQRKSNETLESEWKLKLQMLKQQHEEALTTWHKKYNSAKRTAANYKRYAEDKEAHMLKEYERLKNEYDVSLTKIELRMKETLEQKNKEFQHTIKYLEKKRDLGDDNNNNNNKENQACN